MAGSPRRTKNKIKHLTKEDHYTASFTPIRTSVYTLQVSHSAKDLGRTTLYQFNTVQWLLWEKMMLLISKATLTL